MRSLTGMRYINTRAQAELHMKSTGMTVNAKPEVHAVLGSGFALLAIHDTLLEIRDLLKANTWEAQQHNQLLVKLLQANSRTAEKAEG